MPRCWPLNSMSLNFMDPLVPDFFSTNMYYSTTRSSVCWICHCRSLDVEGKLQTYNVKLWLTRGQCPNTEVAQGSTVMLQRTWGCQNLFNLVSFSFGCCCCCHISRVRLCVTPETAAHQAPPSLGFSRQEHWSGLPFPSPMRESEKGKWSRSVVSNS